jgi:hypothetical protein
MKTLVIALAAVLLLAGCSAGHPAPNPFTTHYGQSAVTIADHIQGCEDVANYDIGAGTQSGMTSGATCTLGGRKIIVFSFKDAASANFSDLIESNNQEQYWAAGSGWAAFDADDSVVEFQLTNNTTELAKYMFDKAVPTPDITGEKDAAQAVAGSLKGRVAHFAG